MINKEIPDHIKKFLEGVVGMVEANNFETMCIWRDCNESKRTWEQQHGGGYGMIIGTFHKRLIFISLSINIVDGYKILFWEATSLLVDYKMIEEWFKIALPIVSKENSTYASKFVNIIYKLEDYGS